MYAPSASSIRPSVIARDRLLYVTGVGRGVGEARRNTPGGRAARRPIEWNATIASAGGSEPLARRRRQRRSASSRIAARAARPPPLAGERARARQQLWTRLSTRLASGPARVASPRAPAVEPCAPRRRPVSLQRAASDGETTPMGTAVVRGRERSFDAPQLQVRDGGTDGEPLRQNLLWTRCARGFNLALLSFRVRRRKAAPLADLAFDSAELAPRRRGSCKATSIKAYYFD